MSAIRLFDPSSDDESEQMNQILKKLQHRPPKVKKYASSSSDSFFDDEEGSSSDDEVCSPHENVEARKPHALGSRDKAKAPTANQSQEKVVKGNDANPNSSQCLSDLDDSELYALGIEFIASEYGKDDDTAAHANQRPPASVGATAAASTAVAGTSTAVPQVSYERPAPSSPVAPHQEVDVGPEYSAVPKTSVRLCTEREKTPLHEPSANDSALAQSTVADFAEAVEPSPGEDFYSDFDEEEWKAVELQIKAQNKEKECLDTSLLFDSNDDTGLFDTAITQALPAFPSMHSTASEPARTADTKSSATPPSGMTIHESQMKEVPKATTVRTANDYTSSSPLFQEAGNDIDSEESVGISAQLIRDAFGSKSMASNNDRDRERSTIPSTEASRGKFSNEAADAFGFDIEPGFDCELLKNNQASLSRYGAKEDSIASDARSRGVLQTNSSSSSIDIPDASIVDDDCATFGFDTESVTSANNEVPSAEMSNERRSEIDPSFYVPPANAFLEEPIVHHFTVTNRPIQSRQLLHVAKVFHYPVNTLWKEKFDTFNQLQSELAHMLAYSDDNVIVSAPTGAGKTAVFEMAIARFLAVDLGAGAPANGGARISSRRKIVYISPSKALCEERFDDWSKRLSAMKLGIQIAVITGDGDPGESFNDLSSAHFILSTPEKWDSLTRRWTENFFLFASVKLFMVDEVHLIADESRGCCLEAIVSRMKAIQLAASRIQPTTAEIHASSYSATSKDALNSAVRFVAVSATLPNIPDFASFFGANEAHTFDESYRPVPLTTHAIGQGSLGDSSSSHWHFWRNFDRNVPEIIIRYSEQKPSIVFCHSKADTEKLADLLATAHRIGERTRDTACIASQTRVNKLQRVLMYGIAYHHAGLEVNDRRLVEKAFKDGKVRVLCATSTLAMGVNLPAHLVVVKGTKAWRGSEKGYQDLDQSSLLQMIGRAGRPGFDTSGTAVIMTDNASKAKFQKLASTGLEAALSQCTGDKLVETINAAVSQYEITSTNSAISWMKGTLYYRQLAKNPSKYGVQVVSSHSIDSHLVNLCKTVVERLRSVGVLQVGDGQAIYPLPAGHIMSQNLVGFQAMKKITGIPSGANQCQVLKALCEIEGLQRPVRRSEKKVLNAAHKKLKMYKLEGAPSKVRVKDPWEKAFVLLQVHVDELELEGNDYALKAEMASIVDFSSRMLAAIEEYSVKGSKHGNIVFQSLRTRRSLKSHLWNCRDGILRQISGVGKAMSFALNLAGISTFEDVLKSNESLLEKVGNRSSPFGANLIKTCSNLIYNSLKIAGSVETEGLGGSTIIKCQLTYNKGISTPRGETHNSELKVSYTLIAYTELPGGLVLFKENIMNPMFIDIPVSDCFSKITIRLVASIIGLDDVLELKGNQSNECTPRAPQSASRSERKNDDRPKTKTLRPTKSIFSRTARQTRIPFHSERIGEPLRHTDERRQSINSTVTPSPTGFVASGSELQKQYSSAVTGTNKQYHQQNSQESNLRPVNTSSVTPSQSKQSHQYQRESWEYSEAKQNVIQSQLDSLPIQKRPPEVGVSQLQRNTAEIVANSIGTHRQCVPSTFQPCDNYHSEMADSNVHRQPEYLSQDQTRFELRCRGNNFRASNADVYQELVYSSQNRTSVKRQAQSSLPHSNEASGVGISSWNKSKRDQQISQRRAFVQKRDNPFAFYNHDPNHSETVLDSLSSKNCDSVIPKHGFQILEAAYQDGEHLPPPHRSTIRGRNVQKRIRMRARVKGQNTQDLLAQKADEFNLQMVSNSENSLPWGGEGHVSQNSSCYSGYSTLCENEGTMGARNVVPLFSQSRNGYTDDHRLYSYPTGDDFAHEQGNVRLQNMNMQQNPEQSSKNLYAGMEHRPQGYHSNFDPRVPQWDRQRILSQPGEYQRDFMPHPLLQKHQVRPNEHVTDNGYEMDEHFFRL